MRFSQLQRPDVDVAFTKTKLDPSLPPQNRADGTLTYLLGVEERSKPGVLIGDMGCHDANPGSEEVGYMFLDEFWGKGYATEALKSYLDHHWGLERREYVRTISEGDASETTSKGDEVKEVEVLRAITEVGNVGSIHVLQKCGFRETRRFLHENGAWRVDLVMERPNIAA
jgi:RimJ/RimL family protein N-acetyltransferase